MIVTRENERLYPDSWGYNVARIMSELAKIVTENGGRVSPHNAAIISNRTITGKLVECEKRIERYRCILDRGFGGHELLESLHEAIVEAEELRKAKDVTIKVTHTSYISFVLDEFHYYYQVDDNPFFEFYYTKTPILEGKYSLDASIICDTKEWLKDVFFKIDCHDTEIREAAEFIFDMLIKGKVSPVIRAYKKERVPNTYNDGFHYETVYEKERFSKIDF